MSASSGSEVREEASKPSSLQRILRTNAKQSGSALTALPTLAASIDGKLLALRPTIMSDDAQRIDGDHAIESATSGHGLEQQRSGWATPNADANASPDASLTPKQWLGGVAASLRSTLWA